MFIAWLNDEMDSLKVNFDFASTLLFRRKELNSFQVNEILNGKLFFPLY